METWLLGHPVKRARDVAPSRHVTLDKAAGPSQTPPVGSGEADTEKGSSEAPAGHGSGSSLPPFAPIKVEKVDSTYDVELGHAARSIRPPRVESRSSVSKNREEVAEKGIWELMIRFSVLVVAMERMISRHIMHVADWEKLETLMSRWGLGARMNSPKIPMVGVWVSGASATMEMQLMILEPARTGLGFEEISKAYTPVDMGLTSHLPHSEDRLCSTDCSQQDQLH